MTAETTRTSDDARRCQGCAKTDVPTPHECRVCSDRVCVECVVSQPDGDYCPECALQLGVIES